MKKLFLVGTGIGLALAIGCNGPDFTEILDPEEQAELDSLAIQQYIDDNDYGSIVTWLESGVAYAILDEGTGAPVDYQDIVIYDYTGELLDGSRFDTSVDSILIEIIDPDAGVAVDTIQNSPLTTTHTREGWFQLQQNFIPGFNQGVHYILDNVNINGLGVMIIPSGLAYGRQGVTRNFVSADGSSTFNLQTIPPDSPLVFYISPIRIR